jgi:hypothetical protein
MDAGFFIYLAFWLLACEPWLVCLSRQTWNLFHSGERFALGSYGPVSWRLQVFQGLMEVQCAPGFSPDHFRTGCDPAPCVYFFDEVWDMSFWSYSGTGQDPGGLL